MTLLIDLIEYRPQSEQHVSEQCLDAIPKVAVTKLGAQPIKHMLDLEVSIMTVQVTGLSRDRNQLA